MQNSKKITIHDLEELRDYYQRFMDYLPPNEGVEEAEKPKIESQPHPQKPQNQTQPKPHPPSKFRPKPKTVTVRPGFEGPKVVRKKRENKKP